MSKKPNTHDYTVPRWGHDYVYRPINGGLQGRMCAWGSGVRKGDFLILRNSTGSSRYRVRRIKYFIDPPDQWAADVIFWPRSKKSAKERNA